MERMLFAQALVSSASGPRRAAVLPLSVALHALATGALLTVSALTPETLPITGIQPRVAVGDWIAPTPPPPVTVSRNATPRAAAARPRRATGDLPAVAPTPVAPVTEDATLLPSDVLDPDAPLTDSPAGCVGCTLGSSAGDGSGSPGGNGDGTGGDPSGRPLRADLEVRAPRKIRNVDPIYPALPLRSGLGGTVVLECVIERDGRVGDVRVVKSHPLFDQAAREAIEQWRYQPTLLGGVPVRVVMTVTIHFQPRR